MMTPMRVLLLLLTVVLGLRPAVAADALGLELSVWSTAGAPTVSATIAGHSVRRVLESDGQHVYRARLEHPPGRLLSVSLRVGDGPVTEDLIVLHHGEQSVSWVVDQRGQFLRSAAPESQGSLATAESLSLVRGALWIFVVAFVLVSGRLERGGPEPDWRVSDPVWFLAWCVLALGWTWPAVLSDNTVIAGLHFDAPGTLWVMGAAGRLMGEVDPLTAWPLGADLSRLDSYLLVPVSAMLSSLGPGRLFGLLSVLGVALSALAAQQFARALGARAPWTALAGLGFGFSGMAATGLLEGHIYQVFNPWLPWFGAALWRATAAEGRRSQSALAVGLFALCWLTSAYVGLMAVVLSIGLFVFSERRPRGMALGLIGVFIVYVGVYISGSGVGREAHSGFNPVSAHLSSWLAATAEMDRMEHAMGPVLFGWMLGLVLLSTRVLGPGRWRRLLWVGVGGGVLSMAPGFAVSPSLVLLPINLEWISGPVAGMLRFPLRLAWLWSLCGGVIAALVATQLAPRWGRLGSLVLVVAVMETFIRVGPISRQALRYVDAPEMNVAAEGALLELMPMTDNRGQNLERWMASFSCVEQSKHGRAIAEDCLHAKPRLLRAQLNTWLQDRLNRGAIAGLSDTLAQLGFGLVLLRNDRFTVGQTAGLDAALRSIDPQPTTVADRGVYGTLFTVSSTVAVDTAEGLQQVVTARSPRVSRRTWASPVHHGRFNGSVALGSVAIIILGLGVALRRRWSA
jgi:hypothetical protein